MAKIRIVSWHAYGLFKELARWFFMAICWLEIGLIHNGFGTDCTLFSGLLWPAFEE